MTSCSRRSTPPTTPWSASCRRSTARSCLELSDQCHPCGFARERGPASYPKRVRARTCSSEPALFLAPLDRLGAVARPGLGDRGGQVVAHCSLGQEQLPGDLRHGGPRARGDQHVPLPDGQRGGSGGQDRKSTRLNSSHVRISYAVFCLKKK